MIFNTLEELSRAWINLARGQSRLFLLEAKLAGNSIGPFLAAAMLFIIMGGCVFLFTLLTLTCCLFYFSHNLLFSFLVIEIIALIIFAIIGFLVISYLKNMSFAKTREYFKTNFQEEAQKKLVKDSDHE